MEPAPPGPPPPPEDPSKITGMKREVSRGAEREDNPQRYPGFGSNKWMMRNRITEGAVEYFLPMLRDCKKNDDPGEGETPRAGRYMHTVFVDDLTKSLGNRYLTIAIDLVEMRHDPPGKYQLRLRILRPPAPNDVRDDLPPMRLINHQPKAIPIIKTFDCLRDIAVPEEHRDVSLLTFVEMGLRYAILEWVDAVLQYYT